jgi:hypothetical protein
MIPTRVLKPGEAHGCFVGSGECNIPAVYEIDDGMGGREYICIPHMIEFEAVEKAVEAMSPEQVAKFQAAVDKAHREGK